MIALVKFAHIAALVVWSAGLVGLPLVLAKHSPDKPQFDYARLRIVTHYAYTRIVTPAAVLAIAFGTALIFLRGVFVPWLFVKLMVVGLLVALHAYVGHVTLVLGEEKGEVDTPGPTPLVGAGLVAMLLILLLVLGKPVLGPELFPAWLLEPQGHPLPVSEVPN
ncbi:MAG: CopD family protein [Methylobacterium mesophilicum]|nr:CopD family protein [Methylobacterium mesophilicum]